MDFEKIRINLEKNLYDDLWYKLQGKTILNLISKLENGANKTLKQYRQSINSQSFKVTKKTFPELHKLFFNILDKLEVKEKINLFIDSRPNINAGILTSMDKNSPHLMLISSGLLERFTYLELKFVIGHEIGHIIYKTIYMDKILTKLRDKDNNHKYNSLDLKLNLWYKLVELNADRIGLLAADDLDSCISSFLKLTSGLDPRKININKKEYVKEVENIFEKFKNNEYNYSISSHPLHPIRLKLLKTFANSKAYKNFNKNKKIISDEKLKKDTEENINFLLRYYNDNLEILRNIMIITGGLLMATQDDEIDHFEINYILEILSNREIFPNLKVQSFLKDFEKNREKILDLFINSISEILSINPSEKYNIIIHLIKTAIVDKKFLDSEIDFILDIGQNILGFHEKEIYKIILDVLKKEFSPSISNF